jgi:NTP pyrophosphatase (non-canonical NTP hydrolase)
MKINEAIAESHNTAKEKGFWDKPNWNIGEKLMLITSELGEALEADRKDQYADVDNFNKGLTNELGQVPLFQDEADEKFVKSFETNLKDKFEDELADATIRLFDLAGKMNIDLEYFMMMKMKYNKTRTRLHGKKY